MAQIVPDQTLGSENSVVNSNVNIDNTPSELITGGASRGSNLFHSFEKFNIREGESVYFNNPAAINRIFSRVTGNEASTILGTLGVLGSADLFLVNPQGIIFGSGASLDIQGSLIATTANGIIFQDNIQFSATNPTNVPLLLVSTPIGLQFGETPKDIISKPSTSGNFVGLQVPSGKTLALVGGNLGIQQTFLLAPEGRIELGSVGERGEVSLHQVEKGWNLGYENIDTFKNIQLSQLSIVDVGSDKSGEINLRGGQISLIEGSQLTATGGKITITASDTARFSGSRTIQSRGTNRFIPSGIENIALDEQQESIIIINATKLIIEDRARITTDASGVLFTEEERFTIAEAPAGNIMINALDSVEITGQNSLLSARTSALTAGGNITINTRNLRVENGASLSTESLGRDGRNRPLATGPAGQITINASDSVLLNRGLIVTQTQGLGKAAGQVSITTSQLNILNEGIIGVGSQGIGGAGNIEIFGDSLRLDNQGKLIAETDSGDGGNINIQLENLLQMRGNSQISTTAGIARSSGNGGNIFINAKFILSVPEENSDISANAFQGRGGNINITTEALLGIIPRDRPTDLSDITASSELGINGIIQINRPDFEPQDQLSQISNQPEAPQLAQGCQGESRQAASRFVITGRGGLSSDPTEPLNNNSIWEDIQIPHQLEETSINPQSTISHQLVEAQGWIINGQGKVILISQEPKKMTKLKCEMNQSGREVKVESANDS